MTATSPVSSRGTSTQYSAPSLDRYRGGCWWSASATTAAPCWGQRPSPATARPAPRYGRPGWPASTRAGPPNPAMILSVLRLVLQNADACGCAAIRASFSLLVQHGATLRLPSACGQVGTDRPPLQLPLPADAVRQARDHHLGHRRDRGVRTGKRDARLVRHPGWRLPRRLYRVPGAFQKARPAGRPSRGAARGPVKRARGSLQPAPRGPCPCPAGHRRLAGSPTHPGPRPRRAGNSGSQTARRQLASGTPGPSPRT